MVAWSGDACGSDHSNRVSQTETSGHATYAGLRDFTAAQRYGRRSSVRGRSSHHRTHQPLDTAGCLSRTQHRLNTRLLVTVRFAVRVESIRKQNGIRFGPVNRASACFISDGKHCIIVKL